MKKKRYRHHRCSRYLGADQRTLQSGITLSVSGSQRGKNHPSVPVQHVDCVFLLQRHRWRMCGQNCSPPFQKDRTVCWPQRTFGRRGSANSQLVSLTTLVSRCLFILVDALMYGRRSHFCEAALGQISHAP